MILKRYHIDNHQYDSEISMTKYMFFTGKGGVGKTSLACATAIHFADMGKKVLLVSTDPASNLADVLGADIGNTISTITSVPLLDAININPEHAAQEYRQRTIEPLLGKISDEEIHQIRENLSGACTTEIASFDEFTQLLASDKVDIYNHIIFDTAPTGHTLRLLELPAAWTNYLDHGQIGASCLGPSSSLKNSQSRYQAVVRILQDRSQTTFYLVSRPEPSALKEVSKTSQALKDQGMHHQNLYINGVFTSHDNNDNVAQSIALQAQQSIDGRPDNLKQIPMRLFPLLGNNLLGIDALRSIFQADLSMRISNGSINTLHPIYPMLDQLVGDLANNNKGLIMTMGKGGVGKTIIACAIAIKLAKMGHSVHLTTTDPAAHIDDFLQEVGTLPSSLSVDRIDPKIETKRYTDQIFAYKSKGLDENEQALLREDLTSPCNEEVAVFHAFSKVVQKAKKQFVIIDTAPTGHTLLLLDTAGSYHRQIMQQQSGGLQLTTPYMRLQDQHYSKVILVALPETTPIHEAQQLSKDLERANIQPYAWVVNQSLSAVNGLTDPLLCQRAGNEMNVMRSIEANRIYQVPYLASLQKLNALLELMYG